jgi:hypothetical protein
MSESAGSSRTAHAENTPRATGSTWPGGDRRRGGLRRLCRGPELAVARADRMRPEAVAKVVAAHAGHPWARGARARGLGDARRGKSRGSEEGGHGATRPAEMPELGAPDRRGTWWRGDCAVSDPRSSTSPRWSATKKEARQGDEELVLFVRRAARPRPRRNGPRVEVLFRRALRPTVAVLRRHHQKTPTTAARITLLRRTSPRSAPPGGRRWRSSACARSFRGRLRQRTA